MAKDYFHGIAPLRVFAITAALSLFAVVSHGASDVLVVASLDHYPPYSGHDLKEKGFCPDVTRTALERAGYKVDVQLMDWHKVLSVGEQQRLAFAVRQEVDQVELPQRGFGGRVHRHRRQTPA